VILVAHWSAQVWMVDSNWLVLYLLVEQDVHQLLFLPESPSTKIGWLKELLSNKQRIKSSEISY
jgi:hypothetical protein